MSIRCKTRDVAFTFRMGAGFAGDVNRTHPAEIEPAMITNTAANVPTQYGIPVLADGANGVRQCITTDASATAIVPFGFAVRPYPVQQSTGGLSAAFGAAVPPTSGVLDVLRAGLIMGQLNVGSAAPVKGGTVYVWAAATSGNHIQGGLETAASAGNTVPLDARYSYNGPADANGVVEISANV